MEEKIITYKVFDNPASAHIIKTRLESNDIPCFLADEHTIGVNPLYNIALGGIKLKIFEKDLERCNEILETDEGISSDDTDVDSSVEQCPECGSQDVGYGNATQKRFGFLTMVISFLFFVYPFKNKKAWHCYNCGKEF
jgi:hypothetical protein